jgi:hypothetical protein
MIVLIITIKYHLIFDGRDPLIDTDDDHDDDEHFPFVGCVNLLISKLSLSECFME